MYVNTILQWGNIERRHPIRPTKNQSVDWHAGTKNKKELQAFLCIINYLEKFSPGTADVYNPLWKLTSSKVAWTWNMLYQQLFAKAKSLIKESVCMKFYNDTKPLYLETDALELAWEQHCYSCMKAQCVRRTWHQITQSFAPLCLLVNI